MAPRTPEADVVSPEGLDDEVEPVITEDSNQVNQKRPPMVIVWRNVISFTILHLAALYAVFLIPKAHPLTWLWGEFVSVRVCVCMCAYAGVPSSICVMIVTLCQWKCITLKRKRFFIIFFFIFFFFFRSPAISLGFTTFGWDFCVCDRFLIQPLR